MKCDGYLFGMLWCGKCGCNVNSWSGFCISVNDGSLRGSLTSTENWCDEIQPFNYTVKTFLTNFIGYMGFVFTLSNINNCYEAKKTGVVHECIMQYTARIH